MVWVAAGEAAAATLSWSGSGGNANWNNSANWGFAGTPANGDVLIFPSGQPNAVNTNNIVGLTVNQIRFAGAAGGYSIRGNAFTVTNGIAATNSAGINVISNSITFSTATNTIQVATSATLNLGGPVGGSVNLIKTGAGTLIYSGGSANTHSGVTTINDGELFLEKSVSNGGIVGSALTIGDGIGLAGSAVVQDSGTPQISSTPAITINGDGLLDIIDIGEGVGNSLTLNNGGDIDTGAGSLGLAANSTITVNPGGGILEGSTISGSLGIGAGTCTIFVSPSLPFANSLTISANMTGSGNLVKTGSGTLVLSGANTYTGVTTISNGFVNVNSATALGGTAGTVLSGGNMLISGVTVNNEWLTNNSSASMVQSLGASASGWSSNIVLNADLDVDVFTTGSLDFSGVISGVGGITKRQAGTLILSGASGNSYTGPTVVNTGILELDKSAGFALGGSLTIGDGIGGALADVVRYTGASFSMISAGDAITINSSGWLDLNGHTDDIGPLTFNEGGRVTTGAGTLSLNPGTVTANHAVAGLVTAQIFGKLQLSTATTLFTLNGGPGPGDNMILDINAQVSGSAQITQAGTNGAILMLSGSNTFTGTMTVNHGILLVRDSFALGSTNAGTTINPGGRLSLSFDSHVGAEGLTNYSSSQEAIVGSDGTNSWSGIVVLQTNMGFNLTPFGDQTLIFSNTITGPGSITKWGPGTLVFAGATPNTYAGTTTVNDGTLALGKLVGPAVPGDLFVGNGFGGVNSDEVELLNSEQIGNTADVTVNSPGLLNIGQFDESIASLAGNGNVALLFGGPAAQGDLFIVGSANTTFTGVISGPASGGQLWRQGTGTLTLTGNNTYDGTTEVESGTLIINGSQPQSDVDIGATGVLGGSGTVGRVNNLVGGVITPGASPGILTSSNIIVSGASSDFTVELNGTIPGTGYDQLNVRGTNSLGGSTLNVNATFSLADAPAPGAQFVIINNDGVDPIAGIFTGRPDNSVFLVDSLNFRIDYDGGTGNDVVLTLTNLPGAQVGAVGVASGDGNGTIDPNECNLISIVVSNQTAIAMTGISATLSSQTAGATVIGSISPFPDIPAFSRRTNTVPFQISTAPFFTCGDNIELQLALQTATHNSFSVPVLLPTGTPGAPVGFSNSTPTAIPDGGTLNSTVLVSGLVESIGKVVVSLHVTYPQDQDLDITLEAPDGTLVELTTDNGATGGNYGTSCAARTIFDDAAATAITSGVAPFTGTFRPEGKLTDFRGMSSALANGTWTLHVTDDSFNGFSGTLQCWTLNLLPATCSGGSGACENCPDVTLHGALGPTSPLQSDRMTRDGGPSACGFVDACPGPIFHGAHTHDAYVFRNGPSNACISVTLVAPVSDFYSAAYSNSFNPADLCTNFMADSGASTEFFGTPAIPVSYSFNVASNATFVVTVNGVDGSQFGPYSLTVSGGDCRPVLDIGLAGAGKVLLDWTTAAPGYHLERTDDLAGGTPSWTSVTNIPIVINSRFHVTNNLVDTNRFYWLRKPLP